MNGPRPVLVFEGITYVPAPSPAWAALTPPAPARRVVAPAGVTTSPRCLTTDRTTDSHRTSPRPVSPPSGEAAGAVSGAFDAAVSWAIGELAAGRSAGWRVVARERGLSEHHAKLAAKAAKDQHGAPVLRAVEA